MPLKAKMDHTIRMQVKKEIYSVTVQEFEI